MLESTAVAEEANVEARNFGGGPGGEGGASGNFLVGQRKQIATTHAVGLNYIDTWGKNKRKRKLLFNAAETNKDPNNKTRIFFKRLSNSIMKIVFSKHQF